MKVLVTGAGGFVGKHLVQLLKEQSCDIFNIGSREVTHCTRIPISSLLDKSSINSAISSLRPDYIFHLAGTLTTANILEGFTINTFFHFFKYFSNVRSTFPPKS